MSHAAQLQFAVWFTGICCVGSFAFLGWLLWQIFWNWYDSAMQKRKRRMATSMTRDELQTRRLERSVAQRIQTIKAANR